MDRPYMRRLIKTIKTFIETRDLTQQEFCDLSDGRIARHQITNLFRSAKMVDAELFYDIAEAMDMAVEELYREIGFTTRLHNPDRKPLPLRVEEAKKAHQGAHNRNVYFGDWEDESTES